MGSGRLGAYLARCDARLLGAAAPLLWLSLAHARSSELFCWCALGIALGLAASPFAGGTTAERRWDAMAVLAGLGMAQAIVPLAAPEALAHPFWLVGGIGAGCALACWFHATTTREPSPAMATLAAGLIAANLLRAVVLAIGAGAAGDIALLALCACSTPLLLWRDAVIKGNADEEGDGEVPIVHLAGAAAPFLLVSAYLGFAHQFPYAILGHGEVALPYALAFACAFCLAVCLWFLAELNRWGRRQLLRIAALALSILVLVALFADRSDKYVLLGLQMSSDYVVIFSLWVAALAVGWKSSSPTRVFCAITAAAFLLEGIGAYIGALAPVNLFLIGFPREGIYLFTACAFAAILIGLASVAALLGGSAPQEGPRGDIPEERPPETPEPPSPAPAPAPPRELATLEELCAQLGQQHDLTEREVEIVRMLAQGRTRSRIAETLFLSQNTVQWYCRQIYQKLDIHSKQELLSLLGIE